MTTSRPKPRWLLPLIVAVLLCVHFGLRVIPPWPEYVRPDGRIVLPENDSWFHYREALHTNAHFPAIQRVEDTSRYPEVERIEASGLWDVTLAGLARIAALGAPSPRAVAWVCLLLPPLLGLVIWLLLARVAAAQGPPALGVWLVAWAVLAPGNTVTRTGLGFCDHHVAEMLLSLVCLLAVLRALRQADQTEKNRWQRPAWLEALPLAIFVFTWVGAPIYALLTALVFTLAMAVAVLTGERARPVALAGARLFSAFIVIAGGAALLWPDLVMQRYLFAATLAGASLAAIGLPLLARALEAASARFGAARSVAGAVALIAIGFTAAYVLSDEVRQCVHYLLGRKSPLVQENRPVTLQSYFMVTGLPGILAVVAPALGILTGAWQRRGWSVTVAWSFGLLMLWYRTWDYDYLGGLHALVLAGGAIAALAPLREKRGRPALPGRALALLTAAIAALAIWLGVGGPPYVPARAYRDLAMVAHPGWLQAMDWLRAQPPPPAPDFTRPLPRGRSGVLCDWVTGNLVNTLGGWPAVAARYMDAEALQPLLSETEEGARAAPLRGSTVAAAVRYVALDPMFLGNTFYGTLLGAGRVPADYQAGETIFGPGRSHRVTAYGPRYRALFAHRLLVDGGKGLRHFRLVYESPQETFLRQRINQETSRPETRSDLITTPEQRLRTAAVCAAGYWQEPEGEGFAGHIVPSVRLYEQVEGARVAGRTAPGARVTFTLALQAGATGRRFVYEQAVTADAEGRFELIVPYATEAMANSDVQPAGPGRLRTPAGEVTVVIPELAVSQGSNVEALKGVEAKPTPL